MKLHAMTKARRELIMASVSDAVADLIYYNRKEDEELPLGAIEDAIADKEITVDEIVSAFRAALEKGLVT